jgi:hypothetical protein
MILQKHHKLACSLRDNFHNEDEGGWAFLSHFVQVVMIEIIHSALLYDGRGKNYTELGHFAHGHHATFGRGIHYIYKYFLRFIAYRPQSDEKSDRTIRPTR